MVKSDDSHTPVGQCQVFEYDLHSPALTAHLSA
jgi:hypothetical protein